MQCYAFAVRADPLSTADTNAVMNSNTNRRSPTLSTVAPANTGTKSNSVSEMNPRIMYSAYEVIIPLSRVAICRLVL